MKPRQIPKTPHVPKLNRKAVGLLTSLCFREDSLSEADIIFVFGTAVGIEKSAEQVVHLLNKGLSHRVMLTGGVPDYMDSVNHSVPESHLFYTKIKRKVPKDIEFFLEDTSINTLENVTEALKITDFRSFKSILFVSRSFAAGRNYLTLKKHLPYLQIFQHTLDAHYPEADTPISRDNWHRFSSARSRVWGEFLRIVNYGEKGDIAYEEIRELVQRIQIEVGV